MLRLEEENTHLGYSKMSLTFWEEIRTGIQRIQAKSRTIRSNKQASCSIHSDIDRLERRQHMERLGFQNALLQRNTFHTTGLALDGWGWAEITCGMQAISKQRKCGLRTAELLAIRGLIDEIYM